MAGLQDIGPSVNTSGLYYLPDCAGRSLNGTTALTIVMNGTDFELSFNDILVPVRTLLHILRKYMNMCWHDALELIVVIVAFMQSIHE